MSTKFLTATVSALVLMAATGAYANDYHSNNMNDNAAIQKGQSASVKAYGANKQGDHYNTNNVRERNNRDMSWDERHTYPGERDVYGTASNITIQKGGSAIADSQLNTHVGQEAAARPYGTYWR
jgi:hypothetical protein